MIQLKIIESDYFHSLGERKLPSDVLAGLRDLADDHRGSFLYYLQLLKLITVDTVLEKRQSSFRFSTLSSDVNQIIQAHWDQPQVTFNGIRNAFFALRDLHVEWNESADHMHPGLSEAEFQRYVIENCTHYLPPPAMDPTSGGRELLERELLILADENRRRDSFLSNAVKIMAAVRIRDIDEATEICNQLYGLWQVYKETRVVKASQLPTEAAFIQLVNLFVLTGRVDLVESAMIALSEHWPAVSIVMGPDKNRYADNYYEAIQFFIQRLHKEESLESMIQGMERENMRLRKR